MAAGVLQKPGSKLGPCKRCEHRDCRESRAMAAAVCRYCSKPIGYGTRYYSDSVYPGAFVHADCAEDAAEVRK